MANSPKQNITGGCACGEIRFEADSPPADISYCHCRLCRRTSGAPMLVFACFALEDFRYTSGKAAIYFSTKNGERRFCPACGTHIEYRERQNALFAEVNIGALDQPELFPPQFHIWESSRIRWLHIDDELPRYSENEPSSNNI